MAPFKRARCETEDPADMGDPADGSVEAKKPKTANVEASSSKTKRPPRNRAEEQELNKLDQQEYVKITKKLSHLSTIFDLDLLARKFFWEKFYAKSEADTFPEDRTVLMNSHTLTTVVERRKSSPWYFWGLDDHYRQRFPEEWLYFHLDGESGGDYLESPLLFPRNETQATSKISSGVTGPADKTGSFSLPLDELEKAIENNEKEISRAISVRDKKRAESDAIRKKASEFQANYNRIHQKIIELMAKCNESDKKATESNKEADKLDEEVSQSEKTLKEKQPLLKVQKLVLDARRANDNYGNPE